MNTVVSIKYLQMLIILIKPVELLYEERLWDWVQIAA